jgi:hypothetical protein
MTDQATDRIEVTQADRTCAYKVDWALHNERVGSVAPGMGVKEAGLIVAAHRRASTADLQAELEAIQGPREGGKEDDYPAWLSDLLNILHGVEDEGDRCYFGSTNDFDTLKEVIEAVDQASHPLRFFRRPDLHRHNKELRTANADLQAALAEALGLLRSAYIQSDPYIAHNCGIGEVRDEIEDFLAKHEKDTSDEA